MSGFRVENSHGGAHVRFVLDRPKGNIVTAAVLRELRGALATVRAGTGIKLISLEGAGMDFSYGASVEEHVAGKVEAVLSGLNGAVLDLLRAPAPTLAIVRGRCLGGGFELALACDMVFADENALLGVPEVTLGVFPPAAAALLPLRIGASRAARAIVGGEALPAAWWAAAGIVDRVVASDQLQAEVDHWYETRLAPRSAAALSHAAEAARSAIVRAVPALLEDLERQYLDRLMRTHDASEGIAAFIERRAPVWRDA